MHFELLVEWLAQFLVVLVKWDLDILGVRWWEDIWMSGFRHGYIGWRIVWHGCFVSVRRIVYTSAKLGSERNQWLDQVAHVRYFFFQFYNIAFTSLEKIT